VITREEIDVVVEALGAALAEVEAEIRMTTAS
jgi:hypothetical protein